MELAAKIAIYFIIISGEVDYPLSRSVGVSLELERKERQVVQPTWLSGSDILFVDPTVRVNDQNIKETAAIRESIQKAIDDGTFAIDVSEPGMSIPTVDNSKPAPNPRPFFPQFDFRRFDISQLNFQFFSIEQQNAFAEQMRRIWQEFIEHSRKWFNIGI